jgi:hypothetical protein
MVRKDHRDEFDWAKVLQSISRRLPRMVRPMNEYSLSLLDVALQAGLMRLDSILYGKCREGICPRSSWIERFELI